MRAGRKSSKYIVGIFNQLFALVIRQAQILKQNLFLLLSICGTAILAGIVFGSVFYKMKTDVDGAFTRGGAIFLAIFYNAMVSKQKCRDNPRSVNRNFPMNFMGEKWRQNKSLMDSITWVLRTYRK